MLDNKGLFIPSIGTTNYGNKSLRFAAPIPWIDFVKSNPEILSIKHKAQVKKMLIRIINLVSWMNTNTSSHPVRNYILVVVHSSS